MYSTIQRSTVQKDNIECRGWINSCTSFGILPPPRFILSCQDVHVEAEAEAEMPLLYLYSLAARQKCLRHYYTLLRAATSFWATYVCSKSTSILPKGAKNFLKMCNWPLRVQKKTYFLKKDFHSNNEHPQSPKRPEV